MAVISLRRVLGKQKNRESICGGVVSKIMLELMPSETYLSGNDKTLNTIVKDTEVPNLNASTFARNLPFGNRSLCVVKLWNQLVPCKEWTGLTGFLDVPHCGEPSQSPHKSFINGNTKKFVQPFISSLLLAFVLTSSLSILFFLLSLQILNFHAVSTDKVKLHLASGGSE